MCCTPGLIDVCRIGNINRTATLALMGADLEKFKAAVVTLWAAGYTDSPAPHTSQKTRRTLSSHLGAHVAQPTHCAHGGGHPGLAPHRAACSNIRLLGRVLFGQAAKNFPQWADQIELYNKRLLGWPSSLSRSSWAQRRSWRASHTI